MERSAYIKAYSKVSDIVAAGKHRPPFIAHKNPPYPMDHYMIQATNGHYKVAPAKGVPPNCNCKYDDPDFWYFVNHFYVFSNGQAYRYADLSIGTIARVIPYMTAFEIAYFKHFLVVDGYFWLIQGNNTVRWNNFSHVSDYPDDTVFLPCVYVDSDAAADRRNRLFSVFGKYAEHSGNLWSLPVVFDDVVGCHFVEFPKAAGVKHYFKYGENVLDLYYRVYNNRIDVDQGPDYAINYGPHIAAGYFTPEGYYMKESTIEYIDSAPVAVCHGKDVIPNSEYIEALVLVEAGSQLVPDPAPRRIPSFTEEDECAIDLSGLNDIFPGSLSCDVVSGLPSIACLAIDQNPSPAELVADPSHFRFRYDSDGNVIERYDSIFAPNRVIDLSASYVVASQITGTTITDVESLKTAFDVIVDNRPGDALEMFMSICYNIVGDATLGLCTAASDTLLLEDLFAETCNKKGAMAYYSTPERILKAFISLAILGKTVSSIRPFVYYRHPATGPLAPTINHFDNVRNGDIPLFNIQWIVCGRELLLADMYAKIYECFPRLNVNEVVTSICGKQVMTTNWARARIGIPFRNYSEFNACVFPGDKPPYDVVKAYRSDLAYYKSTFFAVDIYYPVIYCDRHLYTLTRLTTMFTSPNRPVPFFASGAEINGFLAATNGNRFVRHEVYVSHNNDVGLTPTIDFGGRRVPCDKCTDDGPPEPWPHAHTITDAMIKFARLGFCGVPDYYYYRSSGKKRVNGLWVVLVYPDAKVVADDTEDWHVNHERFIRDPDVLEARERRNGTDAIRLVHAGVTMPVPSVLRLQELVGIDWSRHRFLMYSRPPDDDDLMISNAGLERHFVCYVTIPCSIHPVDVVASADFRWLWKSALNLVRPPESLALLSRPPH